MLRLELGEDGNATITTLDLFARPRTVVIQMHELREPRTLRPLATFAARGYTYFLDGNVANADLLARLGLQKKHQPALTSEGFDSDEDEDDAGTGSKRGK